MVVQVQRQGSFSRWRDKRWRKKGGRFFVVHRGQAVFFSVVMPCVAEPGSGAFLTPGSRIWIRNGKKPETRSGNQDEHPRSYFWELGIRFGVKILKFSFVLSTLDPGSVMENTDPGSRIRPGSATLSPENYVSGGTINFKKFVRLSMYFI